MTATTRVFDSMGVVFRVKLSDEDIAAVWTAPRGRLSRGTLAFGPHSIVSYGIQKSLANAVEQKHIITAGNSTRPVRSGSVHPGLRPTSRPNRRWRLPACVHGLGLAWLIYDAHQINTHAAARNFLQRAERARARQALASYDSSTTVVDCLRGQPHTDDWQTGGHALVRDKLGARLHAGDATMREMTCTFNCMLTDFSELPMTHCV